MTDYQETPSYAIAQALSLFRVAQMHWTIAGGKGGSHRAEANALEQMEEAVERLSEAVRFARSHSFFRWVDKSGKPCKEESA